MKDIVLTIIVPTYNRSRHLSNLLLQMERSEFIQSHQSEIEVVIANNLSNDGTEQLLRKYENRQPFRVLNHQTHVKSGEENWYRSLDEVNGRYLWIIGDDDLIEFEHLNSIWERLSTNTGIINKLYIFNPVIVHPSTGVKTTNLLKMHHPERESTLKQISVDTGYVYLLAIFSNTILPSSRLKTFDFSGVIKRSQIYSHVAAYMELFADSQATVINLPLVWHRQEDDMEYYKRLASKLGVYYHAIWLRLIFHLEHLIDIGRLSRRDLFYTTEIHHKSNHRIVYLFTDLLFWQVVRGRRRFQSAQIIPAGEFERIADFIIGVEPHLFETIDAIRKLYYRPRVDRFTSISELRQKFDIYMRIKTLYDDGYCRFFRCSLGIWNIYYQGEFFVAVPEGEQTRIKDFQLNDNPGSLYVNRDLSELIKKLESQAPISGLHVTAGQQPRAVVRSISKPKRSFRDYIRFIGSLL